MDAAIQQYLRSTVVRDRDVERIGPFLATFDRTTDHPFLSYAIPDDGAEPSAGDVAALRAAYERRGRVPRLEYLPSRAPAAEVALLAGGFTVEARLALMTCAADDVAAIEAPDGVELVLPDTDEQLRDGTAVANAAFGEPAVPSPDAVARLRGRIARGAIAVLARDEDGRAIGWGQCSAPGDGATELAGIAVDAAQRRRGIAGAITARLAREAFARGVETAFLTPGDDAAGRVYARAGFAARSRMLHLRVAG
ncbi:MAG TPA: GNAT family N-acetyltransferase [Solirubrobacteraceae bacterium]|nr:GNAT family N-acetyltransferase [Solirubrobacteraceae bacterium]